MNYICYNVCSFYIVWYCVALYSNVMCYDASVASQLHHRWLKTEAAFDCSAHVFDNLFTIIHRVSEKTVQISFCYNFVKFPPIMVIFGRKMANMLKLCAVHSFSTSSNLRHHTTVLNEDVPNCYTTLKVVIFNKLSSDLISTQRTKMWFIQQNSSSCNSSFQNCQNLCSKCAPGTRTEAFR